MTHFCVTLFFKCDPLIKGEQFLQLWPILASVALFLQEWQVFASELLLLYVKPIESVTDFSKSDSFLQLTAWNDEFTYL